jgi:hypothetical protein
MICISSLFAKGRFRGDYGREPNRITVHYEKGVTEEEINSFVKRFAKYELRELWIVVEGMRTYWFSEEKKDVDDDTFLNLFKDDTIVRGVYFPPITKIECIIDYSPLLESVPLTPWSFNHLNIPQAWADLESRPTNSFTPVIVTIDSGYFDFYGEMSNRYVVETLPRPDVHLHYHTPSAPRPHTLCALRTATTRQLRCPTLRVHFVGIETQEGTTLDRGELTQEGAILRAWRSINSPRPLRVHPSLEGNLRKGRPL